MSKKSEMISYVERNISVSCDPRLLKVAFNLSESEARLLSALAKEHQQHICDYTNCKDCSNPKLPSLNTILTEFCSIGNFQNSRKLLNCMIGHLKRLSLEEKKTLSTYDWLDLVWEGVTGEITEDYKLLLITFDEEEEFSFDIDDRLISCPV